MINASNLSSNPLPNPSLSHSPPELSSTVLPIPNARREAVALLLVGPFELDRYEIGEEAEGLNIPLRGVYPLTEGMCGGGSMVDAALVREDRETKEEGVEVNRSE